MKSFLDFYHEKPIAEIMNEDIIIFNNEYILNNSLSARNQNQIVNAIKLYFKTIRETKIKIKKIIDRNGQK